MHSFKEYGFLLETNKHGARIGNEREYGMRMATYDTWGTV